MSEATATFDPTLPTDLDRMRDALGDVDTDAALAPDATYLTRLADADDDWRLAAAAMARSFASRAAAKPESLSGDGVGSITWGDRAKRWLAIAGHLEAEAARLNRSGGFWDADPERVDLIDTTGEYSISLRRA